MGQQYQGRRSCSVYRGSSVDSRSLWFQSRYRIAASVAAALIALGGAAIADPESSTLQARETSRDCSDCAEMVATPARSFLLGSSAAELARDFEAAAPHNEFKFARASMAFEHPEHSVSINRPLALGSTRLRPWK